MIIRKLVPLIGVVVWAAHQHALAEPFVSPDEYDWGWELGGEPTFPNEAYGPENLVDLGTNSWGKSNVGDNQLFDVWVPDGAGPFPVYIYAHGGGFTGGSKKRMVLAGPLLANDNVVFVNINYRLNGSAGAPDSINDAVELINYLKAHSGKYKINPDQIFVGGGSAGGVIFNEIIYGGRVNDIKGLWNWNVYEASGQSSATQAAYSNPAVLANFPIPVIHGHPLPTPHPEKGLIANPNSHDPDYAFEHVNNNWAAGNPSMFYKAVKEHPSQIGYKTENQSESEQSLTPTPDDKIKQIWIDGVWYLDYDEESGWVQDPTALNPEEWWAKGDPTINDSVDMPNLAEWIHEIIGNNEPVSPDYAAWKTEHDITDDFVDNDHDGIVNRLEFAFGGDPNTRDAQSLLPTIRRNGSSSEFQFFRGQASLDYIVESSVDLEDWESFVTVDDSHALVGSSATVLVPDSQDERGRLFLRLKVEDAATQPPLEDSELVQAVAGINAGFNNVEVDLLEWPSELHDHLGVMHEFAYVTRPVYSTSGKLPLIVSLHGGGPNWWVLSLEDQIEVSASIDKKRGYDLAELAGEDLIMLEPNTRADWEANELDTMLDYVLENFPDVDPDRVYVTGYSKGGGGTWVWLNESADRFAAAAIGGNNGAGAIDDMTSLVNLPLWLMVGGDDGPAAGMQNRVNQLRAAGNVNVEHTIIDGADHREAGDAFFSSVGMVDWLLEFKLPRTQE